jgi:hypothetical protein
MSMTTQNFGRGSEVNQPKKTEPISGQPDHTVRDGSNAHHTVNGSVPLGKHTDLQGNITPVPDASKLNQFGTGKSGSGSRDYNDSNR